ncbi:MAG TPA: hypothetical protein VFC51_04850 [Chloroflexota bacterium]|nr:hypothetical protein [Chloroflexota bacterium]
MIGVTSGGPADSEPIVYTIEMTADRAREVTPSLEAALWLQNPVLPRARYSPPAGKPS